MKFYRGKNGNLYSKGGYYKVERGIYKEWTLKAYNFSIDEYVELGTFSSFYELDKFAYENCECDE